MPDPSRRPHPSDGRPGPTRRGVLGVGVAAGAATLTGCGIRIGSPARSAGPVPPSADQLARERVARDADALGSLAARAARLVPAARPVLAAVAADHRAHAAALRPAPTAGSPSATASTRTAASSRASTPVLTAATALATLQRAERTAAAAATAELDRVGGDVARLLASVAASRSLHVTLLTAASQAAQPPGGTRRPTR